MASDLPQETGTSSLHLVERFRDGDELAAAEIFDRYTGRLVALAASRISPKLARRIEADDVVQSVFKSFFHRLSENQLHVNSEAGQLWGLLAAITVNKVRSKVRYHGAVKRDAGAEASVSSSVSCYGMSPEDFVREPSPEDAVVIAEQYEQVLLGLSEVGKTVFRMHLEDASVDEISKEIRRSPRTVRRELEGIRKTLCSILETDPNSA